MIPQIDIPYSPSSPLDGLDHERTIEPLLLAKAKDTTCNRGHSNLSTSLGIPCRPLSQPHLRIH